VPQTGGAVLLRLAPWIQVAGVGRVGLDHPTLPEQGDVRVRFGYGGVRVALRPAVERWPGLVVSLLGGAGNVDVQEPTIGNILDSENGGVIEPGVSLDRALFGSLRIAASAAWRFAFEFDEMVGIDAHELGGPALGVSLTLGPF
jgi:hypothetical protein